MNKHKTSWINNKKLQFHLKLNLSHHPNIIWIKSLNTCHAVIKIVNLEITFAICTDVIIIIQLHQTKIATVLTTAVVFKDIEIALILLEEIASQLTKEENL